MSMDEGLVAVVALQEPVLGMDTDVREEMNRGRFDDDELLVDEVLVAVGVEIRTDAGVGVVVMLRDADLGMDIDSRDGRDDTRSWAFFGAIQFIFLWP